jgi:hypothetical protein
MMYGSKELYWPKGYIASSNGLKAEAQRIEKRPTAAKGKIRWSFF